MPRKPEGGRAVQLDSDKEADDKERFFVKGLVGIIILALMYAVYKRLSGKRSGGADAP
jgi:hypothetical protein